ncbi:MAG TPA: hypothetical protein VKD47_00060 [Miltoncostaeaceae bacterium]|nr:hypothetical protein [Miltoncostaeaceae bacterium]
MSIRKAVSAVLAVALVGAFASAAVAKDKHPGPGNGKPAKAPLVFTLQPDPAANPEGVAWDPVTRSFFVGSTGDGAIYQGTIGNPAVGVFIAGAAGKSAVGMKVFHGKLYVAGGSTGTITVYDIATKAVVATFNTGAGGFLNDLVVTGHGDVYVTDSTRPILWHVTRAQVNAGSGTPEAISVDPEIAYQTGFNLNGIVALDNSKRLIVVQSNTGKLFRIDVRRNGGRRITQVNANLLPGGDGMLISNGRLVVVQGGPPAQITFLKLRGHATRAKVEFVRTDPTLRGPSTIARARNLFLVVNADFATSQKPFTVVGLSRHGNH